MERAPSSREVRLPAPDDPEPFLLNKPGGGHTDPYPHILQGKTVSDRSKGPAQELMDAG